MKANSCGCQTCDAELPGPEPFAVPSVRRWRISGGVIPAGTHRHQLEFTGIGLSSGFDSLGWNSPFGHGW